MKIDVADLRPNPFRDLKRYPTKDEKIEALRKSIKATTFWDNLLVRKAPNGDGGYEIAYGHNRLAALKKEHVTEIDVPVRKLSDTDMAKIMAHENAEEWGSSADIEAETIRAIVQGYADGRIELPKAPKDTPNNRLRHAPHFTLGHVPSTSEERPYTAETLGEFLSWKSWRIQAALDVLAASEAGLLDEADTVGLSTKQAQAAATQARRVERETGDKKLAKNVGKRLSQGLRVSTGRSAHDPRGKNVNRDKSVTIHNVRQKADEMVPSSKRKKATTPAKLPPIGRFVITLGNAIADWPTEPMKHKLDQVIKYREELHKRDRDRLISALRGVAKKFTGYADRLEA